MSSSPLESGFNTRDWPVKTGDPETSFRCVECIEVRANRCSRMVRAIEARCFWLLLSLLECGR